MAGLFTSCSTQCLFCALYLHNLYFPSFPSPFCIWNTLKMAEDFLSNSEWYWSKMGCLLNFENHLHSPPLLFDSSICRNRLGSLCSHVNMPISDDADELYIFNQFITCWPGESCRLNTHVLKMSKLHYYSSYYVIIQSSNLKRIFVVRIVR